MLRNSTSLGLVLAASLALSSCGTTTSDRALSGGMLGAGTGAIIGSVAGSAGKGALIGGLGGLALGALTSPAVVNLGEPIWNHHSSYGYHHAASHHYASRSCTTRTTDTQRITTCAR
jgi:osmotically inducible lipoprotein OsmB